MDGQLNRRRMLVRICLLLALLGALAAGMPFYQSLKPSAAAGKDLPRLDVSMLQPGHFAWFELPWDVGQARSWRLLVLRMHNGDLRGFQLPFSNDVLAMPDFRWGRFAYGCSRFGPASEPGPFATDALLRCHDAEVPGYWRERWLWQLDGTAISPPMEAMMGGRLSEEADGIVMLSKWL